MKVISEISLRDFEFWSGGADRAYNCSPKELDIIEEFLEEIEPEEGWTDTAINDFFWFEFDIIAQHLGYEDEADFDRQHDPDYIDDNELEDYCTEWFHSFVTGLRDSEDYGLIIDIAENLFDFESESDDTTWEEAYDFLLNQNDAATIFASIFEDDRGEYETDGKIPSLEDFRDEMMQQHPKNQ